MSFAEIFFGNCIALGLPCLTVSSADAETMQGLIENDPSLNVTVQVEAKTVTIGDQVFQASLPSGAQRMFLSGHRDATGQLLDGAKEVATVAGGIINDFK